MNSELLSNLDKMHTTELGIERIRKNLDLRAGDVIKWCREKTANADDIYRKGKNWYMCADDCIITVNTRGFTIITAHKMK